MPNPHIYDLVDDISFPGDCRAKRVLERLGGFPPTGNVRLGDVIAFTRAELKARERNFGDKSLDRLEEYLAGLGLRLDTDIPGWKYCWEE